MPKISMLIDDADLALIDSVAEPNRTAFMVAAAREAAARIRHARISDEIGLSLMETADEDLAIAKDFDVALLDGLDEDEEW